MGGFQRFEEIEAWQEARILVRNVYAVTKGGRFSRDFGLRDQICRAAVSVMSNIAEGFERDGDKEFQHFLSLAKGSCGEVRSQLHVAVDLGYLTQDQFESLLDQANATSRLLAGLMRYLRQSDLQGRKYK